MVRRRCLRLARCALALTPLVSGCHTAAILAPLPPLRAASASAYAVDVEFSESLDRATAQDPARYSVYPQGISGSAATVLQATLIDTLYGRVVQLLLSDPINGFLPDSALYTVQSTGVLDVVGKSTGSRSVDWRTGLNYDSPLRALFARHCDSCHGATREEGNYRTDSQAGLLAGGTNSTPNLIAGDPKCLVVVKTKPSNSMFRAGDLSYLDFEIIRNWVVSYQARQ